MCPAQDSLPLNSAFTSCCRKRRSCCVRLKRVRIRNPARLVQHNFPFRFVIVERVARQRSQIALIDERLERGWERTFAAIVIVNQLPHNFKVLQKRGLTRPRQSRHNGGRDDGREDANDGQNDHHLHQCEARAAALAGAAELASCPPLPIGIAHPVKSDLLGHSVKIVNIFLCLLSLCERGAV